MNALLITVVVAFVALVISMVTWGYSVRMRRFRGTAMKVAKLANQHAQMSKRARMVEGAAVEYVNSLGKDGVRLLEELQRRLDATSFLVEELESLVASGDPGAFDEVELYLQNEHPRQLNPQRNYDGILIDLRYDPLWDAQIEGMLQRLGETVSQASIAATAVGLPRPRERKTTLDSLLQAGVNLLRQYRD